jgi:hypothetical protein
VERGEIEHHEGASAGECTTKRHRVANRPRLAAVVLAGPTIRCAVLRRGGSTASTPSTEMGTLFQDDLADADSGLGRASTETALTDPADDAQRIYADEANGGPVVDQPRLQLRRRERRGEGAKVGGSDNSDLGIPCRCQDTDDLCCSMISSDG